MNGIPVLASQSGGIPEAGGTGGITLPVPESNQGKDENWLVLPSEEECRPWADALYELYDNTEKWQEGCRKNAEQHSLKVTGDRILKLLQPLLRKKAGDNDFTRLGSVRYDGDPLDWEEFKKAGRKRAKPASE